MLGHSYFGISAQIWNYVDSGRCQRSRYNETGEEGSIFKIQYDSVLNDVPRESDVNYRKYVEPNQA